MPDNIVRIGAGELRFLIDERSSAGQAVVFEMTVPAGARVPAPHHHLALDEVFYGLDGTLTVTLEGVTHELTAGSSCRAAPRTASRTGAPVPPVPCRC